MTEVSSLTLTTMQAELTARWDKACSYMDSGKPLSGAFTASLGTFWAAMEVADGVEASWRRENPDAGCIGSPEVCEKSVFSCQHCAKGVA